MHTSSDNKRDPVAPTSDLPRALDDLSEHGYCIIRDALSAQQVEALRTRVLGQLAGERARGLGFAYGEVSTEPALDNFLPSKASRDHEPPNRWVDQLVNKGKVFRDLLEHPLIEQTLSGLLGRDFLLSAYAAHVTGPGGPRQPLHTDQFWMPPPTPRDAPHRPAGDLLRGEHSPVTPDQADNLISPPVVGNIMWPLDEFTVENGATRFMPGTHLSGEQPDPRDPLEEEAVSMVGPPGSAIVFDGRLWHGAGANTSNATRIGLLTTFCAPMFRQQENYTLGTAPEIVQGASERLLTLLGLKPWLGYGRVGSDTHKFVERESDVVGELGPT